MLTAEVVRDIDDTIVRDTVTISRDSYPPGWSCGDSVACYSQAFTKQGNILIMLRDNEKNVGFLFAVPHNNAVEDLKNDDPLMKEDASTYYVQNSVILPAFRRKLALGKILALLREELRKRGIFTVSMHARVSNGLSRTIQDHLKIVEIRRIDIWKYYANEEATDYIVAEWPHEKETM